MYTEQQFSIPLLQGLSTKTIDEHKKLYGGYVKNANTVLEKISVYTKDDSKMYELGELYRQFSFEFNGMRNHECYFSLLEHNSAPDTAPTLVHAITHQWGTLDEWTAAFTNLALTRGVGWAMLSWDHTSKSLIMHWVDEQHLGQLQGTTPIIALDMWEHSYVADYMASGKKQYIIDFLGQMHWGAAEARFEGVSQKV